MSIINKIPEWLIGSVVTLFFLFITVTGLLNFTDIIEKKTLDFRSRLSASEERNSDIELVVITDDDLPELGRLPWPRDILARGINNLSLSGARVIALNMLFTEPEENAGLRALGRLKDSFARSGLATQGAGLIFNKELSEAAADLDNDETFCNALEKAGNVVLPVFFDAGGTGPVQQAPDFIARYAFKRIVDIDELKPESSIVWHSGLRPLLPKFAEVTAGIGHINLFPDKDGCVRTQVHVLGYSKDTYFPSLAIAIVKLFKGMRDEDIRVVLGQRIDLRVNASSVLEVPAQYPQMRTLINWSQGPDIAFHRTPFSKVLKNQAPTGLFKDKIVIVGPDEAGIGDQWATPISANMAGVEVVANSVANILNQTFVSRPPWISFAEPAILIFLGIFITFVLPRLKPGMGTFITMGLIVSYALVAITLFYFSDIWLKITLPLLLLILGYVLFISRSDLTVEKTKRMRDKAGDKSLMGRDVWRPPVKHTESLAILGSPSEWHLGDSGSSSADADTRATLGRYEIVGELGRGAMGVVYQGQDPKIGRNVAIKTVNLAEFDEEIVDEIRDRFFREAESAGLLAHPNIVTIYDCGEEHDLGFIAMEYLEGEDLDMYTKGDNLLPVREVLRIMVCVLEALDYAHSKNVVHRDIKPANIMRKKETHEIKVMDFGIARLTSSSKTKPGTVLGTPSYMSPEQVSGKKVDGRSDIFSAGVVLFELLTGHKPFVGEDVTTLMFKIAKERHPSAHAINPRTPRVMEKIIDGALQKDLEKRYQKAGHMAAHLGKVLKKMDEILAQRKPEPHQQPG
jgi:CHASE2 domain-containing sensor protein